MTVDVIFDLIFSDIIFNKAIKRITVVGIHNTYYVNYPAKKGSCDFS